VKATPRTVRLTKAQLDALVVAAATAADTATRQATDDPARRYELQAQAAGLRRLLGLLKGSVAAEVTVWVAED
jgi:predicted benzoate:H+ symporter BenE